MATIEASRPEDLGPALREVRLAEEISQTSLAQIADVGRQWLNSFELGDKPAAPLDMVWRVAVALDVSLLLTRPTPTTPRHGDVPEIDLDEVLDRVTRP